MWGKITNQIGPARAALAVVSAGFLFWAACAEEEAVERRSSWREVAVFPSEAGHVRNGAVAADGAFYAAATYREDSFSERYGVVYRSDGGALEEVFRSPYAGSALSAIGAGGGAQRGGESISTLRGAIPGRPVGRGRGPAGSGRPVV